MNLPPDVTEQQALDAIERAARILVPKFERVFGVSVGVDDLYQQIRLFGWEAVTSGKFNPDKQSLEGFVFVHTRNRVLNMRRDLITRSDTPCARCHAGEPCGREVEGEQCQVYRRWKARNVSKANLQHAVGLEVTSDEGEPTMRHASSAECSAEINEILAVIDEELPIHLRPDWLRLREGASLPKPRRLAIEQAVRDILAAEGVTLAI